MRKSIRTTERVSIYERVTAKIVSDLEAGAGAAADQRKSDRAENRAIVRALEISATIGPITDVSAYLYAELLHRRALKIDIANFGPDHPHVAADLNNLEELKRSLHQLPEADELYAQAAAIYSRNESNYVSQLANIANNRGELLRSWGDYASAEPLYRRVRATVRRRKS